MKADQLRTALEQVASLYAKAGDKDTAHGLGAFANLLGQTPNLPLKDLAKRMSPAGAPSARPVSRRKSVP